MIKRIDSLDPRIPVYFLHGEQSWIDSVPSLLLQSRRGNVFVDAIEKTGHHVRTEDRCFFHTSFLDSPLGLCRCTRRVRCLLETDSD